MNALSIDSQFDQRLIALLLLRRLLPLALEYNAGERGASERQAGPTGKWRREDRGGHAPRQRGAQPR